MREWLIKKLGGVPVEEYEGLRRDCEHLLEVARSLGRQVGTEQSKVKDTNRVLTELRGEMRYLMLSLLRPLAPDSWHGTRLDQMSHDEMFRLMRAELHRVIPKGSRK